MIFFVTLKSNRAPFLRHIKLCVSFHHHTWIQTEVTFRKWLTWVLTSVTLTFELWPWPFAWTSLLSLVITPENFMMIQWWEHCEKRVLRVGITGNSVCLAAYHWQMDFCMLRQCFSSRTAGDGHTPYKARPSQKLTKITTCDHVHQIFITSCTWFRRGVLSDRGLTLVRINAVMGCFHEQRDIWTKEQTRQGTESSISLNTSLCCGYVQWNHITIQSIITWYYIWWNNDVDQTMTSQRHSIPHPHRWAMECL